MLRDFPTIQKLVKCLSGIDIYVRSEPELIQKYICRDFYNTNFAVELEQKLMQVLQSFVPDCIYEVVTHFACRYLIAYSEEFKVYMIAGPCFLEPFDEKKAVSILRNQQVSLETECQIVSYLRKLPVISPDQLHQLGNLLMELLFHLTITLPYKCVECFGLGAEKRENVILVEDFDEITKIRRVETRYELASALTEAVKQGNLSLAYWFAQELDMNNPDLQRASNRLRNAQNLCITSNTQLRYAMEESGIHPYYLDAVSAEIARKIEGLKSVEEVSAFGKEIIRQYCNLAQDNLYPDLKPFSKLAVTYIKTHLSDNLTVKGVAKALTVTPDYLSTRFHQEVGITFIDFVNRERINQAAALLKHTNLQIQQIAVAVGYNHTSYFAKQFARYKHTSPRAFRQNGKII